MEKFKNRAVSSLRPKGKREVINLTPHDIHIVGSDGKVIKTFPSEGVIRLSQKSEVVGYLALENGERIPLTKTSFGEAEGLPEQKKGTIYIVSSLVCQAYPDRQDFFIPDQTVRDEKGRIVGCRSLSKNPFGGGDER